MTSIERAMDKLAGEAPEVTARATETVPTMEVSIPPETKITQPSQGTPTAPASESNSASAVHTTKAKVPASRSKPGEINARNFVNLDLERLAAAAFITPDQSTTRQSEEFQQIKRRMLGNLAPGILNNNRPANLILITSSVPNEGKTFVSVNLAISVAMEMDSTVLVVDTDIMKRDLTRLFGLAERPGLFDMLADPHRELEDLLVRTNIPNLVVLPSGNFREGSTELLASLRMKELTNEIAGRYPDRVVIFDSPPVLATTTATALAPLAGQVILVAEAGNTKHETLREAVQILGPERITGLIVNKSKQIAASAYDYYGSYYYRGQR